MYIMYGFEWLTFSGNWIYVLLLLPELMLRLHLPRSCTIFWSAIFPTFLDIVGYELCVYNSYGNRTIICVDALSQNHTKIVGRSYGNRTASADFKVEIVRSPCDVREESLLFLSEPLRSPYDRYTIFRHQLIIKIVR